MQELLSKLLMSEFSVNFVKQKLFEFVDNNLIPGTATYTAAINFVEKVDAELISNVVTQLSKKNSNNSTNLLDD